MRTIDFDKNISQAPLQVESGHSCGDTTSGEGVLHRLNCLCFCSTYLLLNPFDPFVSFFNFI